MIKPNRETQALADLPSDQKFRYAALRIPFSDFLTLHFFLSLCQSQAEISQQFLGQRPLLAQNYAVEFKGGKTFQSQAAELKMLEHLVDLACDSVGPQVAIKQGLRTLRPARVCVKYSKDDPHVIFTEGPVDPAEIGL
jgi:hypothetical protein